MKTNRYAAWAAHLLRNDRDAHSAPPPAPEHRNQAIEAVRRAIELQARQRRRRQFFVGASAALALCAAFALTWGHMHRAPLPNPVAQAQADAPAASAGVVHPESSGGVDVVRAGEELPAADGAMIEQGTRLVSHPQGRAVLAFHSGTRVTLEGKGDLTLAENTSTQRFSLAEGSMQADVAKLASHQRFLIDTPDTQVEVRGTSFRVSVVPPSPACGNGATTRVAVTEGTVAVRHDGAEVLVHAGERWPEGCTATESVVPSPSARTNVTSAKGLVDTDKNGSSPTLASPPPGTRDTQAGARNEATSTTKALPDASSNPPANGAQNAPSSLTAQNNLFADAMNARQRGDLAQAIRLLDTFVATYGTSPLLENAWVERMRLLRAGKQRQAVGAAQSYLQRYPQGFARAEAEAIVGETP